MADENLASQEAEPVEAPEAGAETPDPIAGLASELGWVPQDQFKGEPEKWKPAEQFIRDGRDIQQSTARELRAMREQVERLTGVSSQILDDKLAEERSRWEARLEKAVDDGDHDAARKAATELNRSKPMNGPAPEVQTWVSRNEWFTKDPLAGSIAREVSDRLARDGYDIATQLAEAEKEVRRRRPDLFAPSAKQPPATQTGQNRNPAPSNRAKGFADMPDDARKMALDYKDRHGVPTEDFAKRYWTNRAKEAR